MISFILTTLVVIAFFGLLLNAKSETALSVIVVILIIGRLLGVY